MKNVSKKGSAPAKTHAKDFSASASARWLVCPASIIEVRKYGNRTSSAAEEGTCAHELAQIGLDNNLDYVQLSEYLGKTLTDAPSVMVNQEMIGHVWGYIEYCRSFAGEHFVEIKVDYSPWAPDGFGTSDFIALGDERGAVVDLKYGKGIVVSAENNTQAMLYALGVYNEYDLIYDFDYSYVFELHIYQPRRDNFSVWEITVGEILEFGAKVKQIVADSSCDSPKYNPTEKGCLWCAHKVNCNALQAYTEETIGSMFDDLSLPSPTGVNHSQVLKAKGLIESWLKAVEQHCFELMIKGESVEGFKLVGGRPIRKWANVESASLKLSEQFDEAELFTKTFLTVTQAEKLLGKAKFASDCGDLVIKPDGKPTIAAESDRRKAITDMAGDFEKLE